MRNYWKKFIEEETSVEEFELLLNCKLVENEYNCINIKEEIQEILKKSNFRIELDLNDIKNGLGFVNIIENTYCGEINTFISFNSQKLKILIDRKKLE